MPPGGSADSSQYSYSSSVPSAALPAANRRTVCKNICYFVLQHTSTAYLHGILPLPACAFSFCCSLVWLASTTFLRSILPLFTHVMYFCYLFLAHALLRHQQDASAKNKDCADYVEDRGTDATGLRKFCA